MPFLHSKNFNIQDFVSFISQCRFPEDALMMAFSPAETVFAKFKLDEPFLKETDQGRIFWTGGELKWRCVDGQIRVVYLGTEAPPDGLDDHSHEMSGLVNKPEELILWGVRSDKKPEWIEQQVPQRFVYPVKGVKYSRGRVALVVENWLDESEITHYSRYQSLKEIPGETYADR
ncbi:type III-D CRISPR-associated protein Csx19 [Desulfobacterium sp. N47]|uniref:Uncharacterized protein n=1 Tax=uncultured Desulfobacterium sp. TaxID=201089 RepID=E1YMB7_9BACT|nr:unknown protein [uncultured Desulfobacterium sp.]